MRVHFLHRHVLDTMVILKEVTSPPPTVTPMRHSGPLAYTERKAPCHRTVRHASGAKEAVASGGGAEGDNREVLIGIRGAAGKCDGV